MAKIYLSPSSQQANLGVVPGYIEEVVCNKIADACQKILVACGQEIKRNNPANSFSVHTAESNAWGADIHVPIHTNAAAANARGARVGCYDPANKALESTKLAQKVFDRLAPLTPASTDYLVKYTFNEVTETTAKCVYIEVSFHSNVDDTNWILANIDLIGKTIAFGILDYLGIEYREAALPAPDLSAGLAEANSKIDLLTKEVAATQSRANDLQIRLDNVVSEYQQVNGKYTELTGALSIVGKHIA